MAICSYMRIAIFLHEKYWIYVMLVKTRKSLHVAVFRDTLDFRKSAGGILPPGQVWLQGINLPAPTSECATMNESSSGAFGIPEFMPPDGGETFTVRTVRPGKETGRI